MSKTETGDVITNALLASNVIQEEQPSSNLNDGQVKRMTPMGFPDGQVFYVKENSLAGFGTQRWSRDPLETSNLPLLANGHQLCYIIPQNCIYNARTSGVLLSSDTIIDGADPGNIERSNIFEKEGVKATETSSPRWSDEKTKLLISLVKQHEKDFKGRLRPKGSIWQSIANSMSKIYSDVDKDLCYKKWSNMLRTFRTFKNRNDRSWVYYSDIDKLSAAIDTRCMTYREMRKRMEALRYAKTSVKRFLDRTSDVQEKLHISVSNFVNKMKVLQKQSDDHVHTILSILEEHFCNKEPANVVGECNEILVPDNDGVSDFSELTDLDSFCISQDSSVIDYQNSWPSGDFQLVNESCLALVDESGLHNQVVNNDILSLSDSVPSHSGFVDSNNRQILWERMDDEIPSGEKFPVIDLTDERLHEVIKVTSTSLSSLVGNRSEADSTSEQHLFTAVGIKDAENFVPQYGPGLSGIHPNSHLIVDSNETTFQFLPEGDGTFQFVSLTDHTSMEQQSQLLGSLKKICFTPNTENPISELVSSDSGNQMSKFSNKNSSEAQVAAESELVILSRSQECDSEDPLEPTATTPVTFQLLSSSDDSYQLVCPHDSSTDVVTNSIVKYTDPWSFSVFTPICPVLSVDTTEVSSNYQQLHEGDEASKGFPE